MNRGVRKSFKGIGLDVGNGISLTSSVIVKKKNKKKIYIADVLKNTILKYQPTIRIKINF